MQAVEELNPGRSDTGVQAATVSLLLRDAETQTADSSTMDISRALYGLQIFLESYANRLAQAAARRDFLTDAERGWR